MAEYIYPESFSEAMAFDEADKWHKAIDEEIKSLHENNTW